MSGKQKARDWKPLGKSLGRLIVASAVSVLMAGLLHLLIHRELVPPASTSIAPEAKVTFERKVTKHETNAGGGTLVKTQSAAIVKAVIQGLEPGDLYRFRAVVRGSGEELENSSRFSATYSVRLKGPPGERQG